MGNRIFLFQDDRILYADQPIALVVGTSRDQAAYAGTLIRVDYETEQPAVFGPQAPNDAVQPPQFLWPVASSIGNADEAISASLFQIKQIYTTSDRHHNPMEPHATTAVWDANGVLTLYETTQHIFGTKELVSMCLVFLKKRSTSCLSFWAAGLGARRTSGRIPCWQLWQRRSWAGRYTFS